jgi:hypothetical protein
MRVTDTGGDAASKSAFAALLQQGPCQCAEQASAWTREARMPSAALAFARKNEKLERKEGMREREGKEEGGRVGERERGGRSPEWKWAGVG